MSVAELLRQHCLTQEEHAAFRRTHGYLVIPNALSAAEVDRVAAAVDRHAASHADSENQNVNIADILGRDEAFLDLIDCPTVFPKIWGILGWNIWVNHSHLNVNPPTRWKVKPGGRFPYGWHRDGGAIHQDIDDDPLLMIKVGFYFTDVAADGGATFVIEGSHLERTIPDGTLLPPRARPLAVKRGTAVIYDNRLVHSFQSPNASTTTRKAVFITYAYRWVQPFDRNDVGHLAGKTDPVRQQLLGLTTSFNTKGRSAGTIPSTTTCHSSDTSRRSWAPMPTGTSRGRWRRIHERRSTEQP